MYIIHNYKYLYYTKWYRISHKYIILNQLYIISTKVQHITHQLYLYYIKCYNLLDQMFIIPK